MPFSYRHLFLGGTTFCCCLPVRLGVISMSILGCLVAGLLSILLWFGIITESGLTSGEKAAFFLAAILETLLLGASIFGLSGAILRKQSFIQPYVYILYTHFLINLGVGIYLLVKVVRAGINANALACSTAIQDPAIQNQCKGLVRIAAWVFLLVASIVLIIEFYGAIIANRYLNQLRREKGAARAAQMDVNSAFRMKGVQNFDYSRLPDLEMPPLEHYAARVSGDEFDPYRELPLSQSQPDDLPPVLPIDVGYGGGSWTHEEIEVDEKAVLQHQHEAQNETIHVTSSWDLHEKRLQESNHPSS